MRNTSYEGEILVVYPQPINELVQFLSRAAAGDESTCPPELDALWHRWLVIPKAYNSFCSEPFGVLVEHVAGDGAPCKGYVSEQVP